MKKLDINNWNRRQQFEHFKSFVDPYFSVTIPFDVTIAYQQAKKNGISFFAKYLHDCIKAINAVENLRYRIVENDVVMFDTIHASATLMRPDNTFSLSFIKFDKNINEFINNLEAEKERVRTSENFYPPVNGLDCIHCSALPWINFTSNKEATSGVPDSVPKLAFSRAERNVDGRLKMNVSIAVNHALVDGHHIGLFSEEFQMNLNQK